MSITPASPPAFMTRYNAIMNGTEKLDTVQKLKDFWLFGIEQGWPHPEMREAVAILMIDVLDKNADVFPREKFPGVWNFSIEIKLAGVAASPGKGFDKALSDRAWLTAKWYVENLLNKQRSDALPVKDTAPPQFLHRYNAIMNGTEKLDTVQKLKDFWLFGIEQGWPHPEMREYMAGLMVKAADTYSRNFRQSQKGSLWMAYDAVEGCVFIARNEPVIDMKLYDQAWHNALSAIEEIDPDSTLSLLPVDTAPPQFLHRYNAIMNGTEKLDTVQKLKDFWLFGIEQGWPHPEMREYMAGLMIDALQKNRDSFPFEQYPTVWGVSLDIESATVIGDPQAESLDVELYDRAWSSTLWCVENLLRPKDYDSSASFLVPPAFMTRYNAIMNGTEKLDTVQKLKDFWLFGIEQGWPHPEMRIDIASLMLRALVRNRDFFESFKVHGRVWTTLMNIQSYVASGDMFPYARRAGDDESEPDRYWGLAKEVIEIL